MGSFSHKFRIVRLGIIDMFAAMFNYLTLPYRTRIPQQVAKSCFPRLQIHVLHQAHSFPPSSLDRRRFMLIVSPKKVVGWRGGNQNVEGDLLTFG